MQTASSSASPEDFASLSAPQRWRRAGAALGAVLANPDDTDKVLELLSALNSGPLTRARVRRFLATPTGKQLYDEHRTIDSRTVDLDALAALPAGTLGHAYATFLRARGLTPEVFDGAPPGFADPGWSYVVQRLRQTHDLWHVVTGCNTDPAGEVALQAFMFAQLRSPGNAVLALAGMLRILRRRLAIVSDVVAAYRAGKRARSLPLFSWEDHWATPLAEVRARLGLPVAPRARAAT